MPMTHLPSTSRQHVHVRSDLVTTGPSFSGVFSRKLNKTWALDLVWTRRASLAGRDQTRSLHGPPVSLKCSLSLSNLPRVVLSLAWQRRTNHDAHPDQAPWMGMPYADGSSKPMPCPPRCIPTVDKEENHDTTLYGVNQIVFLSVKSNCLTDRSVYNRFQETVRPSARALPGTSP